MTSHLAEISFQLILHAGNARSFAMEAIQAAKKGDFATAESKIREAETSFQSAHQVQTELLQQEAKGNEQQPTILLVHAQDHLMTALTVKEMAQEVIALYQRMDALKEGAE